DCTRLPLLKGGDFGFTGHHAGSFLALLSTVHTLSFLMKLYRVVSAAYVKQ
ncbi:S-acyl fatty acid synthase thioesterase, medium chain, partial [Clarias magur]